MASPDNLTYVVIEFPHTAGAVLTIGVAVTYRAERGSVRISRVATRTDARGQVAGAEVVPGQLLYLERQQNPTGDVYFPAGVAGHILLGPHDFTNQASAGSGLIEWHVLLSFHNDSPVSGNARVGVFPSFRQNDDGTFELHPTAPNLTAFAKTLNASLQDKALEPGESRDYYLLFRSKTHAPPE